MIIDSLAIYIFVTLSISILFDQEDFPETKVFIDLVVLIILLIASCTLWIAGIL